MVVKLEPYKLYMNIIKSHQISKARSVWAVSDIVTSEVHMELLEIVVFDEADRQDSEHISTGHKILESDTRRLLEMGFRQECLEV